MIDNTELIATARLRAEKYVNGSEAYMLNRLIAAIESAEAERDAALAVIATARDLYGKTGGTAEDLAWQMRLALDGTLNLVGVAK